MKKKRDHREQQALVIAVYLWSMAILVAGVAVLAILTLVL